MTTEKPPMPDGLRSLAQAARKRVKKLGTTAPVADIAPNGNGLESPYADEELWLCLLLDTFGTRNGNVAVGFVRQLMTMIPQEWNSERQAHVVDTTLMQLVLSIICSLRPRNEAEAAIAVHCVALHLATLKVTSRMGSQSWLDPKSASALANVTKAYAQQVQALQQMRKPTKAKRQVIHVQKSVTINYDARQVTFPGGGGAKSENQFDGAAPLRAGARTVEPVECAALPSSDAGGQLVQFPSREGQASLSGSRG